MALSPQKFREIVLQLLYCDDFGGNVEVQEMLMAQLAVTKRTVREANLLQEKVVLKKKEIDEVIQENVEAYELKRIPRVEKNILRLSIYELLFASDVPPKVVIAEAIRLCRKFASAEAASFVNAILDAIYKKREMRDASLRSG